LPVGGIAAELGAIGVDEHRTELGQDERRIEGGRAAEIGEGTLVGG
jgi:hypothetical protein